MGYATRVWDIEPSRSTVRTIIEALDGATLAVIATPPEFHVANAVQALGMKVPWVLIEKPLALSPEEAEPLIDAPNVFVGYCLRFALATQLLPDAIKRIAPVRLVEAVYSERVDTRGSWLAECGVTLEYSHMLDLLLQMFGPLLAVFPAHIISPARAGADTSLVAALVWDTFLGTLRLDFHSPTETRLKVIGDGGVVEWRRDRIISPGCDERVEPSSAWLVREAEELHQVVTGAIPSPGRLCTVKEAMGVLQFAERLR